MSLLASGILTTVGIILAVGGDPAQPGKLDEEVKQLIKQLGDPSFKVREQATRRLIGIGRQAVPILVEALKSQDVETQRRLDAILLQIDPLHRDLEALAVAGEKERQEIVKNLVGFRDPRVVPRLLPLLEKETDVWTLRYMIDLVIAHKDRRAIKPLLRLMEVQGHKVDDAHEWAMRALGEVGDASIAEPLLKFRLKQRKAPLDQSDPFKVSYHLGSVSGNVAFADAAGATGDPRFVLLLVECSAIPYDGHGGGVVGHAVVRGLVRLGPPAVPELVRLIKHPRDDARRVIVEALGKIGDARAVPALEKLLADKQTWIAAEAAVALDRIGSDKGAKWILKFFTPPDRPPKLNHDLQVAAQALAKCKHPSLREPARQLLASSQSWYHPYAAECLANIGDKEGVLYLRSRLKGAQSAWYVMDILHRLGDKGAAPALIRLVEKDPGQVIYQSGIRLLGELGTPEAVEALLRWASGPEMTQGYGRRKSLSVQALGKVRSKRVFETLLKLLDDPEERIRGFAHGSLSEIIGATMPDRERIARWWAHHRDTFPE